MKKLIVGEIERDVSELTNSQAYALCLALADCNEKVRVVSEQENSYALELKKDGMRHVKCYKTNPSQWAGKKGYELLGLDKPTKVLSLSSNKNPIEPVGDVNGIPYATLTAFNLLSTRPEFCFKINNRTYWAATEADMNYLLTKNDGIDL